MEERSREKKRRDRADQLRAIAINTLVHDAADAFIESHDEILAGRFTTALEPRMRHRTAMQAIQRVCLERCYRARDVLKMELSGAEAIQGLLDVLVSALLDPDSLRGAHMRRLYPRQFAEGTPYERLRRITDHIAGMTDRYAQREHERLTGQRLW
mgnify:CR=1 FL=1